MAQTKIPVGDGSFCYTGPSCKVHGARWEAYRLVEDADTTSLQNTLPQRLQALKDVANYELCEAALATNKEQDKLGSVLFQKGVALSYCELHQAYHAFTRAPLEKKYSDLITQLHKTTELARKSEDISLEDAVKIHEDVNVYAGKYVRSIISGGYQEMKTVKNIHMESLREKERRGLATKPTRQDLPEEIKSSKTVLVNPDTVDKMVLIEYWRCGRKARHAQLDSAKKAAEELSHGTGSVYRCPYCRQYHVGHGDGQKSQKDDIAKKARRHWRTNPARANLFAFSKGML